MAKIDLTKYGITGTPEIIYNPSYDDLYKAEMSIEFAFSMTLKMAGVYDRLLLLDSFRSLAIEKDLLARIPVDLARMLEDGK